MGFLGEIERRKQEVIQQELARKAELERQQQLAAQEAAEEIKRRKQLNIQNAERIERDAIGFIKERSTIASLLDQMYEGGYKGYFEKVSEISGFILGWGIYNKYEHKPSANPELAQQQLDVQRKFEDASSKFGWPELARGKMRLPDAKFFGDNVAGKAGPREAGIGVCFSKLKKDKEWGEWRKKRAHVDHGYDYWYDAVCIRIDSQSKATITGSTQRQVDLRDLRLLDEVLEKAIYKPTTFYIEHTANFPPYIPPESSGPCLPGNSIISTPNGSVPIENLESGELVWTIDKFGHRIQAVIIQKTKRVVSKDHKMAHIVLEDGRKLIVSPGHPTIDNKKIGSLVKGQILDKSQIVSVKIMPYKEKYTYDILPSGDTGGYWVNNILIGSTLSNQFKQTQWHRPIVRLILVLAILF